MSGTKTICSHSKLSFEDVLWRRRELVKLDNRRKMYTNPPESANYGQSGGGPGDTGMNQRGYSQGGPSGNMGGVAAPHQNFLGSDQADMMLNLGISQGQSMIKQQQERWMPGISGFWHSLKINFAVNNIYVVKKLSIILYQLGVKTSQRWIRKNAEDGGYDVSGRERISHAQTMPILTFFVVTFFALAIIAPT